VRHPPGFRISGILRPATANNKDDLETEKFVAQASMDRDTLQARVQLVTQVVAISVALLYAVGFIVVSLHHALFGVSQFSLLRPKILSAGLLFFIFFGLPVLESARNYGLFGYNDPFPRPPRAEGKLNKALYYLPIIRILNFIFVSVALSWSVGILFQDSKLDRRLIYWTVAMVVPAACIFRVVRTIGQRRPVASAYLCLFALLWMLFCIPRALDLPRIVLLAWFGWCGAIALLLDPLVKGSKRLRNLQWETWVGGAISTLGFFSLFVYPNLKASLGGGAPVPITLQFAEKSPLDGAAKANSWLIDETDAGFYVLSSREAARAIFIPRASVSAIYFGENPQSIRAEQPSGAARPPQEKRSPDSKPDK
jgi:hypothetical protein